MRAPKFFAFFLFLSLFASAQFDPTSACPLPKSPSLLSLSVSPSTVDETLTASAELSFVNPTSKETGVIPSRQIFFQKCGMCPTEVDGRQVQPCASVKRKLRPDEDGYDSQDPDKAVTIVKPGCCFADDAGQEPISCDRAGNAFEPRVNLVSCSEAAAGYSGPVKPFPCPTGCCYSPTQVYAGTTDIEGKAQIVLPLENVSIVSWFLGDNFYMPTNSTSSYAEAGLAGVNFAACFPIFLLLGFLMAAMHASGRSPFSFIDFSASAAPRARVKAPTAIMVTTKALGSALGKDSSTGKDAEKAKDEAKSKKNEKKPGEAKKGAAGKTGKSEGGAAAKKEGGGAKAKEGGDAKKGDAGGGGAGGKAKTVAMAIGGAVSGAAKKAVDSAKRTVTEAGKRVVKNVKGKGKGEKGGKAGKGKGGEKKGEGKGKGEKEKINKEDAKKGAGQGANKEEEEKKKSGGIAGVLSGDAFSVGGDSTFARVMSGQYGVNALLARGTQALARKVAKLEAKHLGAFGRATTMLTKEEKAAVMHEKAKEAQEEKAKLEGQKKEAQKNLNEEAGKKQADSKKVEQQTRKIEELDTKIKELGGTADAAYKQENAFYAEAKKEKEERARNPRIFLNWGGVLGYFAERDPSAVEKVGIPIVNSVALLANSVMLLRFGARDFGLAGRISGGAGAGDAVDLQNTLSFGVLHEENGQLVRNRGDAVRQQLEATEQALREASEELNGVLSQLNENLASLEAQAEKMESGELKANVLALNEALQSLRAAKPGETKAIIEKITAISKDLSESSSSVASNAREVHAIVAGEKPGTFLGFLKSVGRLPGRYAAWMEGRNPDEHVSPLQDALRNQAALLARRDHLSYTLQMIEAPAKLMEQANALVESARERVDSLKEQVDEKNQEIELLTQLGKKRPLSLEETKRLDELQASAALLISDAHDATIHLREVEELQFAFEKLSEAFEERTAAAEELSESKKKLAELKQKLPELEQKLSEAKQKASRSHRDADAQRVSDSARQVRIASREIEELEAKTIPEQEKKLAALEAEGATLDLATKAVHSITSSANNRAADANGKLAEFSEKASEFSTRQGASSLEEAVSFIEVRIGVCERESGFDSSGAWNEAEFHGKNAKQWKAELEEARQLQAGVRIAERDLGNAKDLRTIAAGSSMELMQEHVGYDLPAVNDHLFDVNRLLDLYEEKRSVEREVQIIISAHQDQIESVEIKILNLTAQREELLQQHSTLEAQLTSSADPEKQSEIQGKLNGLEGQIRSNGNEIQNLQSERDRLSTAPPEYQQELDNLGSAISAQQQKIFVSDEQVWSSIKTFSALNYCSEVGAIYLTGARGIATANGYERTEYVAQLDYAIASQQPLETPGRPQLGPESELALTMRHYHVIQMENEAKQKIIEATFASLTDVSEHKKESLKEAAEQESDANSREKARNYSEVYSSLAEGKELTSEQAEFLRCMYVRGDAEAFTAINTAKLKGLDDALSTPETAKAEFWKSEVASYSDPAKKEEVILIQMLSGADPAKAGAEYDKALQDAGTYAEIYASVRDGKALSEPQAKFLIEQNAVGDSEALVAIEAAQRKGVGGERLQQIDASEARIDTSTDRLLDVYSKEASERKIDFSQDRVLSDANVAAALHGAQAVEPSANLSSPSVGLSIKMMELQSDAASDLASVTETGNTAKWGGRGVDEVRRDLDTTISTPAMRPEEAEQFSAEYTRLVSELANFTQPIPSKSSLQQGTKIAEPGMGPGEPFEPFEKPPERSDEGWVSWKDSKKPKA